MEKPFRRALLNGDLTSTQHLVAAHADKHQQSPQDALRQLMGHVFEDDECGSGLLYLAAGCRMSSRALQTHHAHPSAAAAAAARNRSRRCSAFAVCAACTTGSSSSSSRTGIASSAVQHAGTAAAGSSPCHDRSALLPVGWFSRSSTTSTSSSSGNSDNSADAGRATVLAWMLGVTADTPLDLTLVNARCQGALHCCLLNGGSPHVLQLLLLHLPTSHPGTLKPSWTLEDAAGITPHNLAIALQDWHAVALMVAAGAVAATPGSSGRGSSSNSSSSGMAAAQQMMSGLLPGSSAANGMGSSDPAASKGGLSGLLAGLAGKMFVGGNSPGNGTQLKQQLGTISATGPGRSAQSESSTVSSRGAVSLDEAAVALQLQQAVQQVSHAVGIPPATAMALLAENGYSSEGAIQAALQQHSSSSCSTRKTWTMGSPSTTVCSSPSTCTDQLLSASAQDSRRAGQCMVCFEPAVLASSSGSNSSDSSSNAGSGSSSVPPGHVAMSVQLPCGHVTCDGCWAGLVRACIEDLGVQRAGCPSPGCGAQLCLDDVERLVNGQMYQRYLSLLAQHVVNISPQRRWCPAPGCGRSLQLQQPRQQQQQQGSGAWRPAPPAAPTAEDGERLALTWQAVQAGRGVDVECECGCRFCWACQEPAHEPASCKQVIAWRQLLATAAAAAESDSADWLSCNTKHCPKCRSRTQRQGGCNHMTCKVCGKEWCRVCGQAWELHSQATGGYYNCNLRPATAYDDQGSNSSDRVSEGSIPASQQQQQQQRGAGLLGSVLAAVTSVVLSHKQRHYVGMHSLHEVDEHKLHVLLRYQQLLLAAALQQGDFELAGCSRVAQQQQQQEVAGSSLAQPGGATVEGSASALPGLKQLSMQTVEDSSAAAAAAACAAAAVAAGVVAAPMTGGQAAPGGRSVLAAIAAEQQQQQIILQTAQPQQQQLPGCWMGQQASEKSHSQGQKHQQLLQRQGFSPLPDTLLQQWLACVVECKAALRWSCVRGFYVGTTASRCSLVHLQGQLAAPVEQLLAVIQQLPAAQHVLDATAAAAAAQQRAAARRSGGIAGAFRGALTWWWQLLGYGSNSVGRGGSTAAAASGCEVASDAPGAPSAGVSRSVPWQGIWFDLPPEQLQQQVYYVLAMSQRLQQVQKLMHQAWHSQWMLLRAARAGQFDDEALRAAGAAGVPVGVASSSDGRGAGAVGVTAASAGPSSTAAERAVTALDVVQAGSDPDALFELVAAGVGQLWRSWAGA